MLLTLSLLIYQLNYPVIEFQAFTAPPTVLALSLQGLSLVSLEDDKDEDEDSASS